MSRHPATAAPPDPSAAGLPGRRKPAEPSRYCGEYHCHTDNLRYLVSHPDRWNATLQLQRRTEAEPAWRPGCETTESHITKLLAFGSFTRIKP